MRNVKAVLLDFDGTIVDASEAICVSFNASLRAAGIAELSEQSIRAMIGQPLRRMFGSVDPCATEQQLDAYVQSYRETFLPLSIPLSRVLPGAADALRELSSRYKLAIVTNRMSDGARRILGGHGLAQHFQVLIGSEHVTIGKPHPEPVRMALEALGCTPARALMVGDTTDDVIAGRKAGTRTAGVTTGFQPRAALENAGADHVVDSLAELLPLLSGRPIRETAS